MSEILTPAVNFAEPDLLLMGKASRKKQNARNATPRFVPNETRNKPRPPRNGRKDQLLTRRRVLAGGGLFGAAAVGATIFGKDLLSSADSEPTTYTGEIDQTRTLIQKWDNEIADDQSLLDEYLPKISELSIAYFSAQKGVDPEQFTGKTHFLEEAEYRDTYLTCSTEFDDTAAAITHVFTKDAYFNKEAIRRGINIPENRNYGASLVLSLALHERHHQVAPLKQPTDEINVVVDGIKEDEVFEVGLSLVAARDEADGNNCPTIINSEVDEAVVQYSTQQLSEPIMDGWFGTGYDQWVEGVKSIVVPVFNGNPQPVFDYQSQSRFYDFYVHVGNWIDPTATRQNAFEMGSSYVQDRVLAVG